MLAANRVRAQTEVLEQVQALLLTTPPAWAAGFQIEVRYQSASGLAQIGGDFYDVVELVLPTRVVVGGFLVLAPLLASRLSTRRSQVIAVGLVTLVAATALGLYTSSMAGGQLFIRLLLIVLATLFALVNWGAARRE